MNKQFRDFKQRTSIERQCGILKKMRFNPQQFIIKIKFGMIQKRKRIDTFNELLHSFSTSCIKIVNKNDKKTSDLTKEGVDTLKQLFECYELRKKTLIHECQSSQEAPTLPATQSLFNKDNDDTVNYGVGSKDNGFEATSAIKQKKTRVDDGEKMLSEKIKNLDLGSDYLLLDDEDETNKIELPEIKNQSVYEIIKSSNRKVADKKQKRNLNFDDGDQSEYDMTDYSSNQSSNEGDYQNTHYENEDENKPMFQGLFSKAISSQSTSSSGPIFPVLKFTSKQLLKSPKKEQKRKRLFVGKKKIPRWAEDLQAISKIKESQKGMELQIYGKCIVENLNASQIFEMELEDARTSSAKWNPRMFLE